MPSPAHSSLRALVLRAFVILSILFAAGPTPALPALAASASDPGPVTVVGSPAEAAYVGTGGLIVGSSFTGDPDDRRSLAECAGCHWWLSPVCWRDPVNNDAGCRAVATCAPGQVQLGVWFARPGESPRLVGRFCLGPQGPITPGSVAASVSGSFVRRLPALRPGWQPAVTLTALPTLFRSGQSRTGGPWRYSVAGFAVIVRATTVWRWDFGDGTALTTTDAGGRYPVTSLSHVYRHAGQVTATVTSSWTGTFTVDGYGPFPISPAVAQTTRLTFLVREARAVLVDPA